MDTDELPTERTYEYVIHANTDDDGYNWNTGAASGLVKSADGTHAAARAVLRAWILNHPGTWSTVPYIEVHGEDDDTHVTVHARAEVDDGTPQLVVEEPTTFEADLQRTIEQIQRLEVQMDRMKDAAADAMRAMVRMEGMSANSVAEKAKPLMSRPKVLELLRADTPTGQG